MFVFFKNFNKTGKNKEHFLVSKSSLQNRMKSSKKMVSTYYSSFQWFSAKICHNIKVSWGCPGIEKLFSKTKTGVSVFAGKGQLYIYLILVVVMLGRPTFPCDLMPLIRQIPTRIQAARRHSDNCHLRWPISWKPSLMSNT